MEIAEPRSERAAMLLDIKRLMQGPWKRWHRKYGNETYSSVVPFSQDMDLPSIVEISGLAMLSNFICDRVEMVWWRYVEDLLKLNSQLYGPCKDRLVSKFFSQSSEDYSACKKICAIKICHHYLQKTRCRSFWDSRSFSGISKQKFM